MFEEKLKTQAWDTLRGEVLARKDNRKSKATTSIVLDLDFWRKLERFTQESHEQCTCF